MMFWHENDIYIISLYEENPLIIWFEINKSDGFEWLVPDCLF